MATTPTYTRNLRLRLDPDLTASARSNLERIDLLGSTFLVDSGDTLRIRSAADILIEPESADLGGGATGGTLTIGAAGQGLSSLLVYSSSVLFSTGPSFLDQAAGGTRYLQLLYRSDLSGSVDTTSDRILSLDLQGASRSLVLGGDLTTSGGALTLGLSGTTSVVLPLTGTLATLSGAETLSNKSIAAGSNTITGLTNSSIAALAAISYSKLSLSASIVDTDISASAAVSYSKLNLLASITGTDISPTAAIPYSKLSLTSSLMGSDISPSAAISGSKVVPSFGAQVVSTSSGLELDGTTYHTTLQAAASGQVANLTLLLPPDTGSTGQVLSTDGAGTLSWIDRQSGGATVTAYSTSWVPGDGLTKVVTHGLASVLVDVTLVDETGSLILVGDISVTDSNNITLTSSEVPAGTWTVIIQGS